MTPSQTFYKGDRVRLLRAPRDWKRRLGGLPAAGEVRRTGWSVGGAFVDVAWDAGVQIAVWPGQGFDLEREEAESHRTESVENGGQR